MVGVRIHELVKRFDETLVLRGVNLDIPKGSFAVLVGPSGCGKSTLLRLIAGLERASSGRIYFGEGSGERDVTELEPRERDLAMVFQSYALYPHMSVRKNLEFGLRLRKTDPATMQRRVEEAAKMLEIGHLLDRLPRELSGGQRQRVAMGRAIVREPALFLFDEPLSNLDPALRSSVRVDIRKQHDRLGATSIYVTHDQVEAMTLADQLFVLQGGEVQQSGRPIDIYRAPANAFVARFLGSPSMNMLERKLARGPEGWTVGEIVIRDAAEFDELALGREVTLGIRPHELATCSESEADLLLRVEVVETLGPELTVHGTLEDGQPFVVALPSELAPHRHALLPLRVERLHLFDRASGRSLRR